jgi:mRNA guanylyltransferase
MYVRMKQSGVQYDDRIVEVNWEKETEHWRFMRFRDDKPHANFKSIVEGVIESIADGVERDDVRNSSTSRRVYCL